jgi:hypothetical protein
MGAEDAAVIEGAVEVSIDDALGALGDCPFSAGIILRLHGAEPVHDLLRRTQRRADEVLIEETPVADR